MSARLSTLSCANRLVNVFAAYGDERERYANNCAADNYQKNRVHFAVTFLMIAYAERYTMNANSAIMKIVYFIVGWF